MRVEEVGLNRVDVLTGTNDDQIQFLHCVRHFPILTVKLDKAVTSSLATTATAEKDVHEGGNGVVYLSNSPRAPGGESVAVAWPLKESKNGGCAPPAQCATVRQCRVQFFCPGQTATPLMSLYRSGTSVQTAVQSVTSHWRG